MSIDCFILPLHRFFLGQFTTAAQQIAGGASKRVIVDSDGSRFDEAESSPSLAARLQAKAKVARLKRAIQKECGAQPEWPDEGDCVYSQQFHFDDVLNLYIAWLSLRDVLPPFESLHPYNHPENRPGWDAVNAHKGWVPSFPHLYGFGYANTIGLPSVLPRSVKLWPEKRFYGTSYTRVHSAPLALAEIEDLCQGLGVADDFAAWQDGWQEHDTDVGQNLREGAFTLRGILRRGMEHRLPIVFW